ncbi:uncharacterized protein LOC144144899 [Haemaphysalis longicornis]
MRTFVSFILLPIICVAAVSCFGFAGDSDCPPGIPGVALKVPDPDDCSKYSLCLQFFGFKLDCPEGQHFSVAANQCLPAAIAGCDSGATEAGEQATDVAAADTSAPEVAAA